MANPTFYLAIGEYLASEWVTDMSTEYNNYSQNDYYVPICIANSAFYLATGKFGK